MGCTLIATNVQSMYERVLFFFLFLLSFRLRYTLIEFLRSFRLDIRFTGKKVHILRDTSISTCLWIATFSTTHIVEKWPDMKATRFSYHFWIKFFFSLPPRGVTIKSKSDYLSGDCTSADFHPRKNVSRYALLALLMIKSDLFASFLYLTIN